MTIAYELGNSLYINITNACPCNCTFCLRNDADSVNPNQSLWLEREPTIEEIQDALSQVLVQGDSNEASNKYREIVFCGYGEPTMRLDVLLEIGRFLKGIQNRNRPIRLNTNGLSDLINKKQTAVLLAKCIDHISISLNAPNANDYNAMCDPMFGEGSFEAIIKFAKDCKRCIPEVTLSVVGHTLNTKDIEACQALCDSLGIPMRVR
ncbi:MAG: TatD family nuclease-associated radical SAM protein [Defluviitaleaceae bacterium]|nr:TatD family nuclease-associated radical SAM protein [Defluviitaleaceae bacterium]